MLFLREAASWSEISRVRVFVVIQGRDQQTSLWLLYSKEWRSMQVR